MQIALLHMTLRKKKDHETCKYFYSVITFSFTNKNNNYYFFFYRFDEDSLQHSE